MTRLGVGPYHEVIPKDLRANYHWRAEAQAACLKDAGLRRAVVQACRADILFFVNGWCWTFRPKARGGDERVVPFVTWTGQDAIFLGLVDHIDRQVPLVIEKSRDAGASWAGIYTAYWCWAFHDHMTVGLSSRVGDLVDSKSPDSLFWKLRFTHKWLPKWMWPVGWNPRLHDTEFHFENPETGSIVTGHATTKDIGVAGRCTWFLFDEFARVPNAFAVRDNTKDTSDCRVFVSTHTGPGTCFHSLCTNGVTDKIQTHWSEHPAKSRGLYRYHPEKAPPDDIEVVDRANPPPVGYPFVRDGRPSGGPYPLLRSPWYDGQCQERSLADVRTNLDIDVQGSTAQFFHAPTIRLLKAGCKPPVWEGDVVADPETGRLRELVRVAGGPLKLWCPLAHTNTPAVADYGMGADVALGTGSTPSCLSVFRPETGEKVAQYQNRHISVDEFAVVASAVGWLFLNRDRQPAYFAWDACGGVGEQFSTRFMRYGYGRVYYHEGHLSLAGVRKVTDRPGWHTRSTATTMRMLMPYAAALEHRRFVNYSAEALEETLQFQHDGKGGVRHSGRSAAENPEDGGTNHGDQTIADALAWMVSEKLGASRPSDEVLAEAPPANSIAWRRLIGKREPSWI